MARVLPPRAREVRHFVMLVVGVPWLPLSVFEGFVAELIPAIGTYLGTAVPILVTLGIQGLGPAVALLVWTVIYQQAENCWLSPRLRPRRPARTRAGAPRRST